MDAAVSERLRRVADFLVSVFGIMAVTILLVVLFGWKPLGLSLDVLTRSLTFAGLVLTAIFGTLGRVVDFRDGDKRLTQWGKTALFGGGVSFLVSVTSFAIGIFSETDRNATTLAEIRRAANRIGSIAVFMPLQYADQVFPKGLYEIVTSRPASPGINAEGRPIYVSGCADGFPGFGQDDLAKHFAALQNIRIEVAIVEQELADKLKEALVAAGAQGDVELSSDRVSRIIESVLEWRGLSGSLDVTLASLQAGCKKQQGGPDITFSMGSDDFILLWSPHSDLTRWRSDGSITSTEDLKGKVGIVWTSLFSSTAIPGAGSPQPDYVSVIFPPVGIKCFHRKDRKNPGLENIAVGGKQFALLIYFDRADQRKSHYC